MPSTGSSDTDPGVAALQRALLRRMTPREKADRVRALTHAVHLLAVEGLRKRHPHSNEHEVWYRLAVLRLGEELATRVYGVGSADR